MSYGCSVPGVARIIKNISQACMKTRLYSGKIAPVFAFPIIFAPLLINLAGRNQGIKSGNL
jgi:hypothetical protein